MKRSVLHATAGRFRSSSAGAELERKLDGTIVLALFLTDLTQLKEAQAALKRAYDDLEIRVRERTGGIDPIE